MRRTEVTAKEIPEEQAIFTEAWNFLKAFFKLKNTDGEDEWADCIENYKKLFVMGDKHGKAILSSGLAKAVLMYIEELSKQ